MIRLLADENFNNNIVRGVRLRQPGIDLIRVQDVGLSVAEDPALLEALYRQGGSAKDAALNGRVIPAEKLEELAANQAAASRSCGGVQPRRPRRAVRGERPR